MSIFCMANMARVTVGGYRQAAHMLAHDDLLRHAAVSAARAQPSPFRGVLCGAFDKVTPPAACAQVAQALGVPLVMLPDCGHACYVEQPDRFDEALLDLLQPAPRAAQGGEDG